MITFVLGGARSGKSRYALNLAENHSGSKAYIATATALDEEMRERIERHKQERSGEWITFEEPVNIPSLISNINRNYDVILLDCLTLWLSNILLSEKDVEIEIKRLIDVLFTSRNASSIFIVSNEVGTGIVPENALSRRFRDIAGFTNQKIAEIADEVYFVIAGIPLRIK